MAQKKLLFYVMFSVLCSSIAKGAERFAFKKDDLEFAESLTATSQTLTLQEIKKKWLELQTMLGNKVGTNGSNTQSLASNGDKREWGTAFRIFVSSSMSTNLLKSYASLAKKYDAVLVFNGLPHGSWRELSKLVTEISGDKPELVSIQIDDEAFARFNVTNVPSFVLSKEEDTLAANPIMTFDKVSGSIGIRSALELFATRGELKDIADKLLKHEGGK